MTTQQDEHFSAFIDGELDDANSETVLNKLSKSEEVKKRWHRYHLISDTLRSNLPDAIDTAFSERVMSVIDKEPAILSTHARQDKHKPHLPMPKRLAGAAIAASVAVVAVIGVQNNTQEKPTPELAEMPDSSEFVRMAEQKPPLRELKTTAPAMTVSSSSEKTKSVPNAGITIDPQLHQYIMNHSQRISGDQLQGVIPYARIVVTPATRRQDQSQK